MEFVTVSHPLATARKTIFSFSRRPKKIVFPKNCTGIWSFLYYRERWYLFFPKIWPYAVDRKWKMIFLKKIHGNMIFPSNFLKTWSFQKEPRRHMIFLVLPVKMVFFPENMIFFPGQKVRGGHSEKYMEIWHFCVHVRALQTWCHAPLSKKSKMVLSRKNTPKGDWRSRLTS